MSGGHGSVTQLYDDAGRRKYLTNEELVRYVRAAQQLEPQTQAFCLLLAHAGCRISEALAITPHHLDRDSGRVVFRTLKRRRIVYRAVPVPDKLMRQLTRLYQGALISTHAPNGAFRWT